MDPHIFSDPDPGSQNVADSTDPDPTDPDPKHLVKQVNSGIFKEISNLNIQKTSLRDTGVVGAGRGGGLSVFVRPPPCVNKSLTVHQYFKYNIFSEDLERAEELNLRF